MEGRGDRGTLCVVVWDMAGRGRRRRARTEWAVKGHARGNSTGRRHGHRAVAKARANGHGQGACGFLFKQARSGYHVISSALCNFTYTRTTIDIFLLHRALAKPRPWQQVKGTDTGKGHGQMGTGKWARANEHGPGKGHFQRALVKAKGKDQRAWSGQRVWI